MSSRSCASLLLAFLPIPALFAADRNWQVYLGDPASTHYSSLDQINVSNVAQLRVAWVYRGGDASKENRSQIQCNPLVVDGVLYATTPGLKLFALDAATGKEQWKFDPFENRPAIGLNRGLVYWAKAEDQRILYCADHFLYAVNALTGTLIESFGQSGRVDLKDGLGRDTRQLSVLSHTPGALFGDLLILGTRLPEGPGPTAPGHIRAYHVRTGRLIWRFNTIPQPGEFGYDTWPPDAYQHIGGANCWTGMAVDSQRGLVFCPTGSPAFDFWGGDRIGQNLFGNCLLALDAATGQRRWHFQFVHHDLWDRDLPAPPNLVTVTRDGQQVDAVAQVTKSGHVFLLERDNGRPLFPIEERPVPPSQLQGESAWPTQPVPTKPEPFARQVFSEALVTSLSPAAHQAILAQLRKAQPHQPFAPPSREGTIIFPGFDGGAEWGGAAVDPHSATLFINSSEMAWTIAMVESKREAQVGSRSGRQIYDQLCGVCHGLNREGDSTRAFPSLVGIENRLSRDEVGQLLDTGRGLMPSVAFLSEAQKKAVIGFLFGDEPIDEPKSEITLSPRQVLGGSPYTHTAHKRLLDPDGYPAVKPPWGTLNAIDLNTGEYRWRITLGELPELTARGIPPTGTENYGGPIVTAGGLIFIGATKDEMFRAFDQRTGRKLWETKLPAGGYATPATYEVKGRQYVVIACGGGKMGTPSSDQYVAFALQ